MIAYGENIQNLITEEGPRDTHALKISNMSSVIGNSVLSLNNKQQSSVILNNNNNETENDALNPQNPMYHIHGNSDIIYTWQQPSNKKQKQQSQPIYTWQQLPQNTTIMVQQSSSSIGPGTIYKWQQIPMNENENINQSISLSQSMPMPGQYNPGSNVQYNHNPNQQSNSISQQQQQSISISQQYIKQQSPPGQWH